MPTPGSSLARVQTDRLPAAGAPAGELDFGEMLRRAEVLARTDLVPKALQGKPNAIVLVGAMGAELGVPFATSLKQIDVIEGKAEPSAQLQIGLVRRSGHEVRWGRTSDTSAVIRGRRSEYRNDPNGWTEVEWTIEQARRAGLVDRWVERRLADGKWPDGNTKWKTEKAVVGDDRGIFSGDDRVARGLPRQLPEWATEALDKGELRSKENWTKYPADMLRARAAKALVRMEFSDVMAALGVEPNLDFDSALEVDEERPGHAEPEDERGIPAEDDAIEDADVVEEGTNASPSLPAEETPAEETPDPKSWTGDDWRGVLEAAGVKTVAALKEARRLAEEAGLPLPAAIDELHGTDVAPALFARLGSLA